MNSVVLVCVLRIYVAYINSFTSRTHLLACKIKVTGVGVGLLTIQPMASDRLSFADMP